MELTVGMSLSSEFGMCLKEAKEKTISKHHIAAIHPSDHVQLFVPTS